MILQRQTATFPLAPGQYKDIKKKMLNWSTQFGTLLYLDSNNYPSTYGRYECLLAADVYELIRPAGDEDALGLLQQHHNAAPDWYFGHISYDFKNKLERKLNSEKPGRTDFSEFQFFRPAIVCTIDTSKAKLTIASLSKSPADIYHDILQTVATVPAPLPKYTFNARTDSDRYIRTIDKLRRHIAAGDFYEMNYCCEGYCEQAMVAPPDIFKTLNDLSPAPFAAYYRQGSQFLMCASPERYLQKQGDRLISQPIKGTARRDADPARDAAIKTALGQNIKECAENVMIVDLMRNDLARSCEPGSVQVDELFGIYSFPQVHQMISTVSGQLRLPFTEALRHSFPMGSMTGAPKIKVMELTERYEDARRELFSGTVGYIDPHGNFDFNVVIRSLFYNAATQYLSYQTGGAITYDSDAQQEWEEMRLKAWALERIFM